MKKRLAILLALAMVLSMILPQTAFADEVTADSEYPYESGIIYWGGPQAMIDTSIQISWLDLMKCWGYRISWKPVDNAAAEEESVTVKNTGEDSYTVMGLQPDTRYKIKIRGILKNSEGNLYTKACEIYGTTYIATPEYDSNDAVTSGNCIEIPFKVQEKDAVLKVYRAESAQGPYELIGRTDGTENDDRKRVKYSEGRVTYKDTTVTPGKTYYYKAQSELTIGSQVRSSDDSKVTPLAAVNRDRGKFTAQLLNKKGTYTKKLTWKMGSDAGNYKTVIKKSNIKVSSRDAKDNLFDRKPIGVEYSFNGKKFYKLKNALILKTGKTAYLRLTLKDKLWIRRDGDGAAYFDTVYYESKDVTINDSFIAHKSYLCLSFEGEATMGYSTDSDEGGEDISWLDSFFYDFAADPVIDKKTLKLHIVNDSGIKLSWKLAPGVESYIIRYGRTEEEAKNSEPITISGYQVGYTIDGLERNERYCIQLSVKYKGEEFTYNTITRYARIVNRPQPRTAK